MKETVRKYIESIKRSNSRFAKMSKAEKRVTVAKDVLKALDSKFLNATSGTYFDTGNFSYLDQHREKSLQDTLFEGKVPECDVCAKGALFACAVMRQNEVKNHAVAFTFPSEGSKLSETLKGLFSASQLDFIENYFEASDNNGILNGFNPKKRMQLIMQNIIENNGTFKPSQLPEKRCATYDSNWGNYDCNGWCCTRYI